MPEHIRPTQTCSVAGSEEGTTNLRKSGWSIISSCIWCKEKGIEEAQIRLYTHAVIK